MTALERAARALCARFTISWDELTESESLSLINDARAVLMAVREPGRRVTAAMDAESYPDSYTRWQSGIDAILNEKDTTND